jgi:hypothetical protein
VFNRLQNRIHATFFSFREDSFWKSDRNLNFPADHVKRTIIPFILINRMARIRSSLALTYIATLLPNSRYFCGLLRFLNGANNIVNIWIILHVMKPIVASHLFDLERLRGKRLLFNSLKLELFTGNMVKCEYFFKLIPVLRVSNFLHVSFVGMCAIHRSCMWNFGSCCMSLIIKQIFLIGEDSINISGVIFMLPSLI